MYLSYRLILFNKRRSSEASRAKVEDFSCQFTYGDVEQDDQSIWGSLSRFERDIARALPLMTVHTKADRVVIILLTQDLLTVSFCIAFVNKS